MSEQITFNVQIAQGGSQYYSNFVISGIQGSVTKSLGVLFTSPVGSGNIAFWSTVDVSADINSYQVGASEFLVTAKLTFSGPYTFNGNEQLNFGVSCPAGCLDWTKYPSTFILAADKIPAGTVNIDCSDAPSALAGIQQQLTFTQGWLVVPISMETGTTLSSTLPPGTYTVTAAPLTNEDQTVVATADVSLATVTIVYNESVDVSVTYVQVDTYSAIDVTIGNITPLQNEQFHVTVASNGQTLRDFYSPANYTNPLRLLPSSGTISISVQSTILNNVQYTFDPQTIDASPDRFEVAFQKADATDIPTTGFAQVVLEVTSAFTLSTSIVVRLAGPSPENMIYTQSVKVERGITSSLFVPVKEQKYTLLDMSFIQDSILYVVQAPSTVDVKGNTILEISIVGGINVKVPGFPDFLSFGGITDLTSGNEADFVKARASSIFKYAGNSGSGDPTEYLPHDQSTIQTIQLAHNVAKKLGQTVLPVMISYTCDLSGGAMTNLQAADRLAYSFGNLMISLIDANETIQKYPVPAVGYILNPDFISMCQQMSLPASYPMPVSKPLQDALTFRNLSFEIPKSISETLAGYIQAVNWLMRTLAPNVNFTVTFGWQVNLWGIGSANWIYGRTEPVVDPATVAQKTADYVQDLNVFNTSILDVLPPDFMAIDRYEADDFTTRGYGTGYCFGPYEWSRYFDFCAALSLAMVKPVVPWQIPSSRVALVSDIVGPNIDSQHWGTGGSYILGDAGLNSNYNNINPKLLALDINVGGYKTVKDLFTRVPFDWTNPAYQDFPLRGIVAVLLGGGQTTGIVSNIGNAGPWVLDRLNAYMNNPISLVDFNNPAK